MAIRICTDSTSDFSQEEAKALNIGVVPLKVIFGTQEYLDGIDITNKVFFEKMLESKQLPTTSQPAPIDFISFFEEAKKADDDCIVILVSSDLSGTYQNALLAKNIVDYDRIHLVDSKNVTVATRLLVEVAIHRRNENKTVEEILEEINMLVPKVNIKAILDTLDNLVKGGRLSKSAGFAGSLLTIKPIISVIDGKVAVISKARGKKGSMEALLREMEKDGEIDMSYPMSLGYTYNDENAKELQNFLQNKGLTVSRITSIGSTIGVHAGANAYGIAYIRK